MLIIRDPTSPGPFRMEIIYFGDLCQSGDPSGWGGPYIEKLFFGKIQIRFIVAKFPNFAKFGIFCEFLFSDFLSPLGVRFLVDFRR